MYSDQDILKQVNAFSIALFSIAKQIKASKQTPHTAISTPTPSMLPVYNKRLLPYPPRHFIMNTPFPLGLVSVQCHIFVIVVRASVEFHFFVLVDLAAE